MRILCLAIPELLQDLCDDAGADRQSALAYGELRPLLQRHRRDQLPRPVHTVPRPPHAARPPPRSAPPALPPARPSSSVLWNISTPVTTVLWLFSRNPTISTASPVFTTPRSIRPVTTVPRPLLENTSSTDIMNGFLISPTRPAL